MAFGRIRLKATVENGITEVKTKIKHPMETGARKELETGRLIPAHFIEEVTCEHDGKEVMSAIWGSGVSANPYCAFKFRGGAKGEIVKLSWKDNKGYGGSKAVEIKEAKK